MRTLMPPLPLSGSSESNSKHHYHHHQGGGGGGSGKVNMGALYPVLVSPRKVEIIRVRTELIT